MGQKVHPTGIRLGIVKDWTSKWYADSKTFPRYVAMDHQLRAWHGPAFDRALRWLLAAAVIGGWLGGVLMPISQDGLAAWSAVLAGAILINVFNEELPREQDAQMPAFLFGVALVVAVAVVFRTLSKSLG